MPTTSHVTLVEVGARDGLQNEDAILDTSTKVDLIRRLVGAGVSRIETASFVHPGRVPQMADAEEVMADLGPSPSGVAYVGLVLNQRGLDRALETTIDEVNFVISATEGFSQANQGAPVAAVMASIQEMVPVAAEAGLATAVTISVAFGCPYDGEVETEAVVSLARRAAEAGAQEIALGDTVGVAVPSDVTRLLEAVGEAVPETALRAHFHDTRNTGIANAYAAVASGVRTLDSSVGGAGGCPFAPNATGNVPTEDVLYMLERSGFVTGIDREAVTATGIWLAGRLGKTLPSAIARAGGFP
ncbi:MAG: hydroxymethylglutaryl-CoA lyase [Acidimicrobiia bacterium]